MLTPSHPLLQVPTQPHTLTHCPLNDTPSHTSNSHKSHMTSDTLTYIHTHTLTQIDSQPHTFTHTNPHTLTQVHSHSHSYLLTFTQTHAHINSHTHNHPLKFSYTVTRPHTSSHILIHIPIHTLTPHILTHILIYSHTFTHTYSYTIPLTQSAYVIHTHTCTHNCMVRVCLQDISPMQAECSLIYFWLHWFFVAANSLPLIVVSRGYSLLRCAGFLL